MAIRACLVLTAFILLPCSESARIDMPAGVDMLHDYEPGEKLVACQRRHGAEDVNSWFEPVNGDGKDVHDGEELIYMEKVDHKYIKVTWNGEPGKIRKSNTKPSEKGCKPKDPDTKPSPPPPVPGNQLPLVIAHFHDGNINKTPFTPKDEEVASPDKNGIHNGQVMQCLDKPCRLDSNKDVTVLFRGVEGTVEGRNLIWGTEADFDDFYNDDILMGPCGARLARLSQEKMELVSKLFKIHDPHTLGKGSDVTDDRPDYDNLQIRSVWEVLDRSPQIKAYKQHVSALNKKHNSQDFHMETLYDNTDIFPPSGLHKPSREKGWLEENEYWLVRGASPKYQESLICEGSAVATKGMFGHGIYLADAADKMDQYVEVDTGASSLEWALNSNKDPLVEAAAEQGTKSVGMGPRDVYIGGVMRAYMGHHVELQMAKGHHKIWWRDPAVNGDERDQSSGSVWQPPFQDIDSLKVVCADTHHDESHPGCEKRGKGHDKGNFPYRWNEYVVPGSDGLFVHGAGTSWTQNAVLKFLVVYDRVK